MHASSSSACVCQVWLGLGVALIGKYNGCLLVQLLHRIQGCTIILFLTFYLEGSLFLRIKYEKGAIEAFCSLNTRTVSGLLHSIIGMIHLVIVQPLLIITV